MAPSEDWQYPKHTEMCIDARKKKIYLKEQLLKTALAFDWRLKY